MAYIHINLTPYSELENKLWYLLEVACVVSVIIIMTVVSSRMIADLETQTAEFKRQQTEAESSIADFKRLEEDVSQIKDEVSELESRLASMKSMDLSGLNQFESVMIMELIHTLKPSGVWFRSLKVDPDGNKVNISAYSNEITNIAEFYRALNATQEQNPQNNDVRSKVSFNEIEFSQIREANYSVSGVPQQLSVQTFDLVLSYEVATS